MAVGSFWKYLRTHDYFWLVIATIGFACILYLILGHLTKKRK